MVVLAAVIFSFDSLREKRSVPLTEQSGIVCFKTSGGTPVCRGMQGENLRDKVRHVWIL